MHFASSLWLLGLFPWAGVTIWLLLGRRRRARVPFVKLWRGQTQSPRAKPSLARPPLAVLLTILSLLLIVLASARPMLLSQIGPAVTIIVDRGITMSARGNRTQRFKETCDRLASPLRQAMGNGPIRLISVPGDQPLLSDRSNWTTAVAAMAPAFQKSQSTLTAMTKRSLTQSDGNVIVVSDQPLPADPRLLQIEPEHPVSNLTIASVAARALPLAQIMVELRDQNCTTDFRQTHMRVESDGHIATQDLKISRNGSATAFIDLPGLGPVVSISVDTPDDLSADNHAWLAREQSSALIEDSPELPEPLRRMIAVYRRHRDNGGRPVPIITNPEEAPADEPSIVIAQDSLPPLAQPLPAPLPASLHVEAHPLTANVDWAAAADSPGETPPPGWQTIVSNGSAALLAVRESPARGVWICLNSPNWPTRTDYVVFWTNVFDWLGGDDVYRWHPSDGPEPGIEKGSDGSVRAYNAIDVDFPPIHPNDWQQLRKLNPQVANGFDLTPATCLLALALIALAISLFTIQSRQISPSEFLIFNF